MLALRLTRMIRYYCYSNHVSINSCQHFTNSPCCYMMSPEIRDQYLNGKGHIHFIAFFTVYSVLEHSTIYGLIIPSFCQRFFVKTAYYTENIASTSITSSSLMFNGNVHSTFCQAPVENVPVHPVLWTHIVYLVCLFILGPVLAADGEYRIYTSVFLTQWSPEKSISHTSTSMIAPQI